MRNMLGMNVDEGYYVILLDRTIRHQAPTNNSCARHVSGMMNMNDYYFKFRKLDSSRLFGNLLLNGGDSADSYRRLAEWCAPPNEAKGKKKGGG